METNRYFCRNCGKHLDSQYVRDEKKKDRDVICPYCECVTNSHTQKLIEIPDNMAYVDEDITELIKTLNKLGLKTTQSCQDISSVENETLPHITITLENIERAEIVNVDGKTLIHFDWLRN